MRNERGNKRKIKKISCDINSYIDWDSVTEEDESKKIRIEFLENNWIESSKEKKITHLSNNEHKYHMKTNFQKLM